MGKEGVQVGRVDFSGYTVWRAPAGSQASQ
jgi:hypothetical protein